MEYRQREKQTIKEALEDAIAYNESLIDAITYKGEDGFTHVCQGSGEMYFVTRDKINKMKRLLEKMYG